jgi:hypothetical protein
VKVVVIERPHEAIYCDVDALPCGPGDVLVRSRVAGVEGEGIVGKILLEHVAA